MTTPQVSLRAGRRSVARAGRASAGATALLALAVGGAVPAAAHVTLEAPGARQGGYAVLHFRVPTEDDTASTAQLRVTFPREHPFAAARTRPMPGWRAAVTMRRLDPAVEVDGARLTEAVDTVTWTATGAGIRPGEFDEFELNVGPLPRIGSLAFPTTQTYDDGETVEWNELAGPGADEPEHPAPAVTLAAEAVPPSATAARPAPTAEDADGLARGLAAGALAAAVAALAVALIALRRRPG